MSDNKRIKKLLDLAIVLSATFLLLAMTNNLRAHDHDLVVEPAPDVTSLAPGDWKSPDIKFWADFGTSAPDIIRRGISNPIYARFYINGIQDFTVPSGGAKIRLHYRNATLGETPPALSDSSWKDIDTLSVTYTPADGPFAITKTWPTDFPSVTTKSVSWIPPTNVDYFHIRSEVAYLGGITDDNLGDNVAISFYESLSGLIDVVLVHDTSGSMGYYNYMGTPYLQHASARAQGFVSALGDNDRLGVVEFNSNFPSGYNDVWLPGGSLQLATPLNKGNANAAISGLSAGGATPMGAGLQRAINLLTAPSPDGITRKKVIILLSDGYENSGTLRACAGANPAAPCVGQNILTQLQTNDIKVFTLALGTSAWTECLTCLATESDGQWYPSPNPGIDMTDVYLTIQQAYTNDDLYSVDRGVSGGGDDSYSTYFEGVDDVLYFILAWDDLEAKLNLQLHSPSGSWVNPNAMRNAHVFSGNGYYVIRVGNAKSGDWGYRIIGDSDKSYLVAVRSDRVGVRLVMDAKSKGFVGDTIDIKARLSKHGKPIIDAKLNAMVQMPAGASLNSKLRELSRKYILKNQAIPLDAADLKKNPDISPRASFVNKITQGKPESLHATKPVSVPLQHIGDGVYSGSLMNSTTVAGTYTVTINYKDQGIARTQSQPLLLRPGKFDPGRSTAEIVKVGTDDDSLQWLLRVYPVDRFNNAITDSSLLKQVEVNIDGGHVEKKPTVAFDSVFQQPVIVEAKKVPRLLNATIGGNTIEIIKDETSGTDTDTGPGPEPGSDQDYSQIVVIIMILLALALAWVWYRKTRNAV
jgi:hypothetical protein